jgi:hypothetical protein
MVAHDSAALMIRAHTVCRRKVDSEHRGPSNHCDRVTYGIQTGHVGAIVTVDIFAIRTKQH